MIIVHDHVDPRVKNSERANEAVFDKEVACNVRVLNVAGVCNCIFYPV